MPEVPERERRKTVRNCLVHWSRCAVELLRLPRLSGRDVESLFEHVGMEHLESARSLHRGVIVVTAHFGNFDLLACAEALRGIVLHVVTRTQHVRGVHKYWMQIRSDKGVHFLPEKNVIFKLNKLLRHDQVVALMIDQHMPAGRGIPVPFFGRPASTTHAPALLAMTTGAPVLPVLVERLPGGKHRVVVDPPIVFEKTKDREADVRLLTERLNRWLEERIRARPDQWLWIHRRWKLLPEALGTQGCVSSPGGLE
jgi:Kdo2-lipid IVA lauroyltransferase/acyltransferase